MVQSTWLIRWTKCLKLHTSELVFINGPFQIIDFGANLEFANGALNEHALFTREHKQTCEIFNYIIEKYKLYLCAGYETWSISN